MIGLKMSERVGGGKEDERRRQARRKKRLASMVNILLS